MIRMGQWFFKTSKLTVAGLFLIAYSMAPQRIPPVLHPYLLAKQSANVVAAIARCDKKNSPKLLFTGSALAWASVNAEAVWRGQAVSYVYNCTASNSSTHLLLKATEDAEFSLHLVFQLGKKIGHTAYVKGTAGGQKKFSRTPQNHKSDHFFSL